MSQRKARRKKKAWISPHMTGRFRGPGRFDAERAGHALGYIESLPHITGTWAREGKKLELLPWQRQVTEDVFGVLNKDGTRQYRIVYVEVPKKNGKTTWAAAIAGYMLTEDGEFGAEVYCAAYDKDQAGITYRRVSAMLKRTKDRYPGMRFQDYRKTILYEERNSLLRALEREAKGQHGFDVHALIFDEFHTQRSSELYDTLQEGTISRSQPLTFIITTAGFDRTSPCWRLHQYARQVISGEVEDPTFYPVIYSAADDDEWEAFDWLDEERWHRANPSMGVTVHMDEFRQRAKRAQDIPSEQNVFKRMRLNVWTQAETRFLPGHLWDACGQAVDEKKLIRERAFGGLDMASTIDVAAFVLVIPVGEELHVVPRFWIPRETIEQRSRDDGVPYEWWAAQGYVIATEGNAIDYDAVEREIKALSEKFDIRDVGFDPWNTEHMAQRLTRHGIRMTRVPQTCAYLNMPTKELLKFTLSQRLRHGANPVLGWMMNNLMVTRDSSGNIKPDKSKSTEKIDGMVALIMAIDRLTRYEDSTVDWGVL